MTDTAWDITAPAGSATIGSIPGHIQDVKDQVATRLDKEHIDFATGGVGGEHIAGSAFPYYQATAPSLRPDGTALTSADFGRVWIDSDDGVVSYLSAVTPSVVWTTASIAGGVGGTQVVLLAGRAGGQIICGGTLTTQNLTFKANAVADATGTILFEGANTAAIDFDSVPVSNLKLGANLDANTSYSVTNLPASGGTTGKALAFGRADITSACLDALGLIGQFAHGTAAGGATKTATLSFSPDLVIAWSKEGSTGRAVWMWTIMDNTANWRLDDITYITTNLHISVASNVITFTARTGTPVLNNTGYTFYYFAIKFNAAQVDPTT